MRPASFPRPFTLVVLLGLSAAPLDAQTGAPPLQVRALRSGPVCDAGNGEVGRPPSDRICPGRDVSVRGLDTCVFDEKETRCTWWGFEFDYEDADPAEPLICVWTRSRSVNEGNYEDVRKRGIVSDTVRYAFESENGHFFFPGFDTYPEGGFPAPWLTVDMEYECVHRDRRAFGLEYRLIFSSAFR